MTDAAGIAAPYLAPRATSAAGGLMSLAEARRVVRPWAALADAAADDNLFFHPDFLLPAALAMGNDRVRVAAISTGARMVAAAPFVPARLGRIAPAVRLWSHEYGPTGVPLLDADRTEEAAAALLAALSPPRSGLAVIIPDMPLDGLAARALARVARASRRSTAVIGRHQRAVAIGSGEGPYDAAGHLSHHRRHEYARLLRRLGEKGIVTIEVADRPDAIRADFDEFLALEATGWKGAGKTALASHAPMAAFARQAVEACAAAGAVRIHSLRFNGRMIAGLVSLIGGRTAFTWKIAYDETEAKASPGAQVMLSAIAGLMTDPEIRRIDSCAGPNHVLANPLLPDRMAMGTFVISPVGEGALYRTGLAAAKLEARAIEQAKRIRGRLRRR